jgi:hypothetical protein
MESHRRSDDHGVQVRAIEQVLEPLRGGDPGMQSPHVRQPLLTRVAKQLELAARRLPHIPN